jgi:prepilin-type N-terminal cleavage/methylation domain-containing protein
MKMRRKRSFTLLEMMIGVALVSIAAGALLWRSWGLVEKKKFDSDVAKISVRIQMLQQMATNMQSDWQAVLKREGKSVVFSEECLDQKNKRGSTATFPLFEMNFLGKEVQGLTIEFFSSGEIRPSGPLVIKRGKEKKEVLLRGWEEGDGIKKLGPLHPEEIVSP